ncbi:MAG: alanine--glyoxylate aminotransferase family protein [Thaumarchaeota archaeon]|nr:alanine--glyoxylate aminotransferase family protein [Candidatus Calditenuaceae archaeon]MDW8187173.1 alanine--glyoxylate aminotransferase family protein [Nitrososphaerota archaeon]
MEHDDFILMLPGPTDVPKETLEAMRRRMINHRADEFRRLHEQVLEKVRKVLGATSGDVYVLTCSSTGGIECAVSNLIDREDRVLAFVNGLFAERMTVAAEYYSDYVIRVENELGTAVTVEEFRKEVESTNGIDVALIVHNETSTGAFNPSVQEISEYCRKQGIVLIVDGVTSIGGYPLELSKWGVTAFVGGTQKCLAAPPGLAIVHVSEEAREKIRKKPKRPHYFDLVSHEEFMKRLETPFTPAITLFYGLDASLDYILERGLERWYAAHRQGSTAFYEALEEMNLRVFPRQQFRSRTLIAARLPDGVQDVQLTKLMKEKYGVLISGGMGKTKGLIIRIGNMGLVTPDRVARTIRALSKSLAELGVEFGEVDVDQIVRRAFSG